MQNRALRFLKLNEKTKIAGAHVLDGFPPGHRSSKDEKARRSTPGFF
jgi:hypothetical protein